MLLAQDLAEINTRRTFGVMSRQQNSPIQPTCILQRDKVGASCMWVCVWVCVFGVHDGRKASGTLTMLSSPLPRVNYKRIVSLHSALASCTGRLRAETPIPRAYFASTQAAVKGEMVGSVTEWRENALRPSAMPFTQCSNTDCLTGLPLRLVEAILEQNGRVGSMTALALGTTT